MPSTTGSSRKRHLRELEVLDFAMGKVEDEHVRECEVCRSKVERLRRTLDLIGEMDRPASNPFGQSLPESVSRALSQVEKGEQLGAELVEIAENGTPSELTMRALGTSSAELPNGLLYACQLGMKLGIRAPQKALRLAEFVKIVSWGLARGNAVPARLVRAEATLLESQALLFQGQILAAIERSKTARRDLRAMKAADFLVARAGYYLGSALAMNLEKDRAIEELRAARRVFVEHGEDSWVGRTDVATGIAIDRASEGDLSALRWYDSALDLLDPVADAGTVASTLQNRALLLLSVGRMAEARRGFSECLSAALAAGAKPIALMARIHLIAFSLEDREYAEAREKAARLAEQSRSESLFIQLREAKLMLAEANAGLGSYGPARAILEDLAAEEDELGPGLNLPDPELTPWLRSVRMVAVGWPTQKGNVAGGRA